MWFLCVVCGAFIIGKTSTILACAKQLYSPTEFNAMVLELNASDDRGIGVVRDQIMSFASTKTIFKYSLQNNDGSFIVDLFFIYYTLKGRDLSS